MKKTIYIALIILLSVSLIGCTKNMTPTKKVEDYLNRYINLDTNILNELDLYLEKEDLTNEQRERYGKIVQNEYSSIVYEIKNEEIDGDDAVVTVSINVKDLFKASKTIQDDLINNPDKYYIDGMFDKTLLVNARLNEMETSTDRVDYTIYFSLHKNDKVWYINPVDEMTLSKIHGIHDYTNN